MRLKKLPKKYYAPKLLVNLEYNVAYSSEWNSHNYYCSDALKLQYIPRGHIESPYRQHFILFKNMIIEYILLFGYRKNPYEFNCYLVS
jgi:hypothetical protein